jgi:hypothetical protein
LCGASYSPVNFAPHGTLFSRFFFTIAGAPANLVFLHANAFDDIAALSQIEAVILRGELYDRATLDAVLDDLGS